MLAGWIRCLLHAHMPAILVCDRVGAAVPGNARGMGPVDVPRVQAAIHGRRLSSHILAAAAHFFQVREAVFDEGHFVL